MAKITELLADWEMELLGIPAPYVPQVGAEKLCLVVGDRLKLTGTDWSGHSGMVVRYDGITGPDYYVVNVEDGGGRLFLYENAGRGFEVHLLAYKEPEGTRVAAGTVIRLLGPGWLGHDQKIGDEIVVDVNQDNLPIVKLNTGYRRRLYDRNGKGFDGFEYQIASPPREEYRETWRIETDITGEGGKEAAKLMEEHIKSLIDGLNLPARVRLTRI